MKTFNILMMVLLCNYSIGQVVDTTLHSRSAQIDVSFYKDGKKVDNKARIELVINGAEIKNKFKYKFVLDTLKVFKSDLIKFRIYYKKFSMETQEYRAELFYNGGSLITGVITDFFAERTKFLSDEEYYVDNLKNKRDIVLRRVNEKYVSPESKPLLIYSILSSAMSEQIMIRYNFFCRY